MLPPNSPAALHRSFRSSPRCNRGFVLLQTLALLLIGCVLATSIMWFCLDDYAESAAVLKKLQLDSAAESGIHRALHGMLNGHPANERFASYTDSAGVRIEVETQPSQGLASLRSADPRILNALLDDVIGSGKATGLRDQSRLKPANSYVDLASLEGIGQHGLACILPYITLFSDSTTPDPQLAPAKLNTLLNLRQNTRPSVMQQAHRSPIGSVVRVRARATDGTRASRILVAEFLFTGRADRPYLTLEWLWIPNDENCRASYKGDQP